MRFTISLTMKNVVIGCLGIGALAAVGCAEGRAVPTSPSTSAGATSAATGGEFPRSGDLHITKNCEDYKGVAGQFCTITSSNVKEIERGTRVVYLSDLVYPLLNTDVVLDTPGPGNNKAFGHCTLNLVSNLGQCVFTGGTGKFGHIQVDAKVTHLSGDDWAWNGTYTFNPRD
jgi:hypothetical protein